MCGGLKQKTDMIPASGAQCDHKTKPHTAAQLTVIIGGLEVMVMGRGTGCGDYTDPWPGQSSYMLGKMDHLCLATPRHSLRDNLSIVNIPLIATLGKWEKWIIYLYLVLK